MTRHLAIDAGQTGIRTRLIDDGVAGVESELPGILTSQPLIPQLAQVIPSIGRLIADSVVSCLSLVANIAAFLVLHEWIATTDRGSNHGKVKPCI